MLALVDYKYVHSCPFRRAPKSRHDIVFGMRVLRLTAEINHRSGRCDKSVKALAKTNADMVCFAEGFPAGSYFNVREPVFSIAYDRLLPQMIVQHSFEGETALLVAGADPRSVEMLRLLTRRYRYILTVGVQRKEIERLRRTAGASVILQPDRARIAEAQLAVFLRQPSSMELSPQCISLAADMRFLENVVHSRYVELPEIDVPGDSPAGFDRRLLVSEALRRGALPWERVIPRNTQILTKLYK